MKPSLKPILRTLFVSLLLIPNIPQWVEMLIMFYIWSLVFVLLITVAIVPGELLGDLVDKILDKERLPNKMVQRLSFLIELSIFASLGYILTAIAWSGAFMFGYVMRKRIEENE